MSLLLRPALELAELVRSGEVTARELAEEALARIGTADGEINAFTHVDADAALAAADAVAPGDPRPFAGVPTAIKDLAVAAAGWPLRNGSALFDGVVPPYDSNSVRRLREAGMVLVGKTATPELGIVPVTEARISGPTRNPWDVSRTPGGSSGGAGAAVAAGMVPVAHGSDGGGSIRIPAACCGLVGLKPSRGRISRAPELGDSFLSTDGVLTRTVADTAALLDLLAGYVPGDATWAESPAEPFAASAAREPGPMRIALALEPTRPEPVDDACADAARSAAELLESLGHHVEEAAPPYPGAELWDLFTDFWAVVVSTGVHHGEMITGRSASPETVEPLTLALHERASAIPAGRQPLLLAALQRIARAIVEWCGDWDAVLTPALAQRPVPIGHIDSCGADPMEAFERAIEFTPYTAVWNVTGQPAVALPLYQGDDGLPLAVQIAGPPAGEGLLLSLAAQLEAALPWRDRVADAAAPAGCALSGSAEPAASRGRCGGRGSRRRRARRARASR